jgi:hypothetical protein
MAVEVQSYLVRKIEGRTKADAERIVEEVTGRKVQTVRETEDFWRFRQFPPERCEEGTEQTLNLTGRGRGVKIVLCKVGR